MLKSLKTNNFRKLTDNEFVFGEGLQVVRGSNEAGKSTMLEAIAYALFGVKACRGSLTDVVTWGKPESSLAVTLVLEIEGIDYVITRKKSGAEVNYADGKVTGQAEVGAFIERLLGVSNATVSKLMLANQGTIRGALASGPKATMELIEQLAGFEVLDEVIDLITEKLQTGPAAPVEERLAALVAQAEQFAAGIVEPDVGSFEQRRKDLSARRDALTQEIHATWEPERRKAEAAVAEGRRIDALETALTADLQRVMTSYDKHQHDHKVAALEAGDLVPDEVITACQERLTNVELQTSTLNSYNAVMALKYPDEYWEGTKASFEEDMKTQLFAASSARQEITRLKGEVAVCNAKKIAAGACGICGKDVGELPEVKAKNHEQDTAISFHQAGIADAQAKLKAAEDMTFALNSVAAKARPIEAAAANYRKFVDLDENFYPAKVSWKGAAPGPVISSADLRAELNKLKQRRKTADNAAAMAKVLGDTIATEGVTIQTIKQRLQVEVASAREYTTVALVSKFQDIDRQYQLRVNDQAEVRFDLQRLDIEEKGAMEQYNSALRQQAIADKAVADVKLELERLGFNNALLKAVRAARPVIADKLWGVVLTAVSTYFSTMRGMQSVVTRQANGFKVDNESVEGLSGSTLDILGLAIRMALTRTFLPMAPFLILDEPSAAMDQDRTEATMGFLVAAGFRQTLLVTHEEISEAVANNLITI